MAHIIEKDADELMHFGIKGMKWGVRRYQNTDGTLTPAGKKRMSKKYKKLVTKANEQVTGKYTDRYADAYNKAVNDMNNGMTEKYNNDYAKKLGSNAKNHDYGRDIEYQKGYEQLFEKQLSKHYNQLLLDDISNNKNYKKAKELCDRYGMTKFDDFVKNIEAELDEIRTLI